MADSGVIAVENETLSPLGVTCDEEGEVMVRLCVVIPGIKKKFTKNDLANGSLEVKYDTRSLELKVHVIKKDHGKTKFEQYRYAIKKLPDEILKDKCYHKVKKDQVILFLHKATIRSWAADLDRSGPETDRPEEND